MAEYRGSIVMSVRLLRPENTLTFEAFSCEGCPLALPRGGLRLTPVRKVKRTWASLDLIVEYRPRR